MILSDQKVMELCEKKRIAIDPIPDNEDLWQAMALDGHLAAPIYRIRSEESGGGRIAIDLENYKTDKFAEQYWERVHKTPDGYYPIHPGEFFLAYTREKLGLPMASKICALVEGKSGLARIGLGIHLAPIIHCGFGEQKPLPVMLERACPRIS